MKPLLMSVQSMFRPFNFVACQSQKHKHWAQRPPAVEDTRLFESMIRAFAPGALSRGPCATFFTLHRGSTAPLAYPRGQAASRDVGGPQTVDRQRIRDQLPEEGELAVVRVGTRVQGSVRVSIQCDVAVIQVAIVRPATAGEAHIYS